MKINLKIKIFFLTIFLLNFNSHSEEAGLPLHGFADVVGGSSSSATPEDQRLRGLSVGTFDLYLTPELDGGVRSLIEIAFEPNGKDGTTGVDVERLQIGYSLSDTNTLWIGRFHTPYGYWNNAYHHGAQLQTSIYRPRFIDFEDKGGILPAHSVGMWLRGWMSLFDDHRLVYDLYSANGPRIINASGAGNRSGEIDPNLIKSDRAGSMTGVNLGLKFSGSLKGLLVGVHAFTTPVNTYSGDGSYSTNKAAGPIDESNLIMTGGYLVYEGELFDFISESYNFSTKKYDTNSSSWSNSVGSSATFAQLSGNINAYHPFVRYETVSINSDSNNNYLLNQENAKSLERQALGIRYDVNEKAALKFEYLRTQLKEDSPDNITFDSWVTQYSIRF